MDLYAENILDHYRHPHNFSPLPAGEGQGLSGEAPAGAKTDEGSLRHSESNPSCGDEITIQLKLDGGHIKSVAWSGTGCAISQAAMSMFSDELIGKTTAEASSFSSRQILDLLGVPVGPRRLKCALLGLHALKNALHQAHTEPLQDWNTTIES